MGKIYTADNFVKSSGTSSQFLKADGSVDSTAYQVTGNYITSLTGEVTASGAGAASATLNNASVTGKILTGVNVTGGSISATDSILSAFGKVQNQINGLIGGSIYQSVWNASTNTPTLTTSVGTKGYYYIVNVAGSTNLNGITDWKVGDWAIYDGTAWQKVDNTDAVSSVNGFTGAVSLTTANISEVTNLYYTEARVNANTNVTANTAARHNAVTLGTNQNGLSLSTQVLSLGLASTSTNGALSSTDWNTFNAKQNALTNPVTGTGLQNFVTKWTGVGGAIVSSKIFDDGTNVGIGSINPNSLLELLKNNATGGGFLNIVNTNTAMTGKIADINFKLTDSVGTVKDAAYIQVIPDTINVNTGASMAFFTRKADANPTESFRISNTGNLGIGTVSPQGKLHIGTTISNNATYNGQLILKAGTSTFGPQEVGGLEIVQADLNAGYGMKLYTNSSSDQCGIATRHNSATWTERLSISTVTGNVGIGTISPGTKLEVSSSDLNNIFVTNPDTSGATTGSGIGFKAYNGSSIAQSAGIFLTANSWSYGTYSANQLSLGSDGTGGLALRSANSAPISFFTGGSSAGVSSERMRIFGTGNVGIGNGSTDNGYKLQVNGSAYATTGFSFAYGQGGIKATGYTYTDILVNGYDPSAGDFVDFYTAGSVSSNATKKIRILNNGTSTFYGNVYAPGFFNSSDIRLKDLTEYDYNVSDIKPITYLWKDGRDKQKHVGYSAQEVQKVMPDAVNEGTDGMLSVNYVEVLVAQVELLNNRMAEMQKEIELLKSK